MRFLMVLIMACGTTAPPSTSVVAAPEEAEPQAATEAESTEVSVDEVAQAGPLMVARYQLPSYASLVGGGDRVAVWVDNALYRLGATGPELLEGESEQLSDLLPAAATSHGIDHQLSEGRRFVVSYGEGRRVSTARFNADEHTRVRLPGAVTTVRRMAGEEEAWLVAQDGRPSRLARILSNDRVQWVPTPRPIGSSVRGLSGVGARACAHPSFHRIASDGSTLVALVVECHRDTPWRLMRFNGDSDPVVTEMPSRRFAPEVMDLLPDGRVVLAGTSPSRIAIEQADGSWDEQHGPPNAAAFMGSAVTENGDIWLLAAAEEYVLLRNGEAISLTDPDGQPISPRSLALDATLGVVVLGGGSSPWVSTPAI